jgi:hypothetical protein
VLVELGPVEQRYRAVLGVLEASRSPDPTGSSTTPKSSPPQGQTRARPCSQQDRRQLTEDVNFHLPGRGVSFSCRYQAGGPERHRGARLPPGLVSSICRPHTSGSTKDRDPVLRALRVAHCQTFCTVSGAWEAP